jgi:uncharacterized protein (DUF2344 family)
MQFKITRAALIDHKTEFKQRILDRANKKFDNIYPNKESTEDFITAIEKLVLAQPIPARITTSFNQVKTIRSAQTTANQSITDALTIQDMRTAWQTFLTTIQGI